MTNQDDKNYVFKPPDDIIYFDYNDIVRKVTRDGIAFIHKLEKDGIKIGFMALDNITYNKGSEKLRKLISDMKANGEVNAFVVCWHTGLEYRGNHEEGTERNARNVIKAGADSEQSHPLSRKMS